MAKLVLSTNDITKDEETQLRQINMCLQDTQNWSTTLSSKLAVNYKQPLQTTTISTASVNYVALPGFNFNFTLQNTLCLVLINLTLSGSGAIGLFINNQLVQEFYTQGASAQQIAFNSFYNMKAGNNTIQLQWRGINGTINQLNTTTNLGVNICQVLSLQ